MPKRGRTDSYLDEWRRMWAPDLEAIAFNGATCDPTQVHPKVLHWAKINCSGAPHFIKVINSGATKGRPGLLRANTACQLSVPGPFVKAHFRELERVVTLENEAGKTWKVCFSDASIYPQWRQGWKRVAADHNLQPGEVIIFVLVANSRFRITRFDEDGNILTTHSTQKPHKKKRDELAPESEPSFKRPRLRKGGEIVTSDPKSAANLLNQ